MIVLLLVLLPVDTCGQVLAGVVTALGPPKGLICLAVISVGNCE